jgi:hypothetical protein
LSLTPQRPVMPSQSVPGVNPVSSGTTGLTPAAQLYRGVVVMSPPVPPGVPPVPPGVPPGPLGAPPVPAMTPPVPTAAPPIPAISAPPVPVTPPLPPSVNAPPAPLSNDDTSGGEVSMRLLQPASAAGDRLPRQFERRRCGAAANAFAARCRGRAYRPTSKPRQGRQETASRPGVPAGTLGFGVELLSIK